LYTAVLGTRQHPVAVRCKGNAEHEVLVALECADALAAGRVSGHEACGCGQLPHLDGLVERSRDESTARRSERNTINAVLVAFLTLEANDKRAALDVPNAHALVERTGCDVEVVGGDGDGSDAVFDREVCDLAVGLEIPEADTAIARSGSDDPSVASKVQGIDVLLVTSELVLDGTSLDVPNTNDLVFGTSRQVLAIRTEAHAPDVEIAVFRETAILKVCNWVSGLNIEDLSRAVATSGDIATVKTEAHTADYTLVRQVVDQVDIEYAPSPGVEDSVPVVTLPLVLSRQLLDIQISQTVSLCQRERRLVLRHQGILLVVGRRGRSGNLGRSRVGSRVVLLRRSRASRRTARRTGALAAGRSCGLWGLAIPVSRRSRLVPTEVLWRAWRRVEPRRTLRATTKLWRHPVRRIAVLRRRSESRTTLVGAASHYAAEEIAGSVANLGRLRLRGAVVVRALAGATALLKFALELGDSVLVLGLHLVVLVLERVHFAADQLNLLDVTSDLAFVVDAALRLGLEFGPDVVQELIQALAGPALGHHGAWGRVAVVHGRGLFV
jgi:hypothetical protein